MGGEHSVTGIQLSYAEILSSSKDGPKMVIEENYSVEQQQHPSKQQSEEPTAENDAQDVDFE